MTTEKKTERVSVATVKSVLERLAACSEKTRLPQSILAESAILAVVEAIEKNGYRVVFPVEFNVAYVPQSARHLVLQEPPVESASGRAEDRTQKSKRVPSPSVRE